MIWSFANICLFQLLHTGTKFQPSAAMGRVSSMLFNLIRLIDGLCDSFDDLRDTNYNGDGCHRVAVLICELPTPIGTHGCSFVEYYQII